MRLRRREVVVLLAPLLLLLGGCLILPAALGFAATLTTYAPLARSVRFVGLANYLAVVRDREFAAAARNVLAFLFVGVPLQIGIGFGIAYALREPFRGRGWLRIVLLLPWLLSPIASGVMWHFLFDSATGLVDFIGGWLGFASAPSPAGSLTLALPTAVAIEAWRVAPLIAFLLLPGLQAVPRERWEDARLDGLGLRRRILDVAVPATRPLLTAVTLLAIGLSLATFDSILILTGGGPGTATITPVLFSYNEAFNVGNWPVGSAAAWLVALAVLAIGAVYVRFAGSTS